MIRSTAGNTQSHMSVCCSVIRFHINTFYFNTFYFNMTRCRDFVYWLSTDTYTTLKYHGRRYQQGTNTLGLSSVYQNANTKCNNLKKIAITFFQQCINHTMMYICIYTTNILVLIVYFGLYNKFPYFHSNMKRIEQYAASKNRLLRIWISMSYAKPTN